MAGRYAVRIAPLWISQSMAEWLDKYRGFLEESSGVSVTQAEAVRRAITVARQATPLEGAGTTE